MTAKELANKLNSKGFDATVKNGLVIVGLNRSVKKFEVYAALDGDVSMDTMNQTGKNVVIIPELV